MKRLTKVFAETTHGTKGYEPVNEIVVNTESICNFSEIVTTLGLLEDVLEEFGITSAEDLRNYLKFKTSMAIWEGKLNYKNKIADLKQEIQRLKQQLHDLPKKIVEDCKMALIKRINIISGYGRMTIDEQSFFFENEYGKDLDTILKSMEEKSE